MLLTDELTVSPVTVPWVCGSCWPAIRPADPPSESESLFSCILLSTSDPLKSVWLSVIPNVRLLQRLEVLADLPPRTRRKSSHSEAVSPAWTRWNLPSAGLHSPWRLKPRSYWQAAANKTRASEAAAWSPWQFKMRESARITARRLQVGWFSCRGNKSLWRSGTCGEESVSLKIQNKGPRIPQNWTKACTEVTQRWLDGEEF